MRWKCTALIAGVVMAALLVWRFAFAMPYTPISSAEFLQSYDYRSDSAEPLQFESISERKARFSYVGHQGDVVHGYIEWPESPRETTTSFPVFLGVSAMGQSAVRWWQAEYKGKPTITQSHRIREMAIAAGYAVVTIDNRYTDSRKDPQREISAIMRDLHLFGDKTDYESMVHGTVMDLRLLLGKLALQPELNMNRVTVVGYSMGAQIGFLLAATDNRIQRLIAMVPPYLDDRTARVAPKNAAPLLKEISVLLLTANDDEYASKEQNQQLFDAIATTRKQHLRYESGHLLPAEYIEALRGNLADTH